MTAPERIWIDAWGGNWSPQAGGTQGIEYIRADLAAVQPAQVCPECSNTGLRDTGGVYPWGEGIFVACDHDEPQPDPRDEVIKGLVEAATDAAEAIDMAYGSDDDESPHRHSAKLRAALAAAKAVQNG